MGLTNSISTIIILIYICSMRHDLIPKIQDLKSGQHLHRRILDTSRI